MTGQVTRRRCADRVDRVGTASRTHREDVSLQIVREASGVDHVPDSLLVLQRPLIFGAFNDTEVVDARADLPFRRALLLDVLDRGAQSLVLRRQLLTLLLELLPYRSSGLLALFAKHPHLVAQSV